MPRRVDPHARGQQVYDAVRALVRDGGMEAVTIRAVAARAELATSSLRQQYRDKDFLLRCVVHECTDRLSRSTYHFRAGDEPVADAVRLLETQLPRDEDERENALLWLALAERARSTDDDVRTVVRTQRDDWLAMAGHVTRHLGVPAGAHDLEAERLALLLEATLAATCDPVQPLGRARAVEILRVHVAHLHRLATSTGNRAS